MVLHMFYRVSDRLDRMERLLVRLLKFPEKLLANRITDPPEALRRTLIDPLVDPNHDDDDFTDEATCGLYDRDFAPAAAP